jgi:L-arabinokinase
VADTIAFYISGHGFGHAARQIALINCLLSINPGVRIQIRTAVPRWLFDFALRGPFLFESFECDTGAVQRDSLHLDEDETVRRAAAFHATLDERADREAERLRSDSTTLVVGDIPPLAFEAAYRAGVPSIAISNFTWDWIYRGYPEQVDRHPDLMTAIARAYRRASLALRLPMYGGFEVFGPIVKDIAFIARKSSRDPAETRAGLGLPLDKPVVLLSFGGHGSHDQALAPVDLDDTYAVVATTRAEARGRPAGDRMLELDELEMYHRGYRYEDLVAAADVVITKPGYGIVSEAIANGTAILYTTRGRFIEYDVLTAAMPAVLRCRFIGQDDLLSGRWRQHLDRLLAQSEPGERPATNGAEQAAKILLDYL